MSNLPVSFEYYYWGPLLWRSKVSLDFCDQLRQQGAQLTAPLNDHLASIIDNVKIYTSREDRKFLVDNIAPYLESYMEFSKTWFNKQDKKIPELELVRHWINFQKPTEFNPEHTHGGDLSFVIYLDIPESIKTENEAYTGTSAGPGAIVFRYGEDNDWAASTQDFLPVKGDIFIFPAKLSHTVFPYKAHGERVSVAGNFKFIYD